MKRLAFSPIASILALSLAAAGCSDGASGDDDDDNGSDAGAGTPDATPGDAYTVTWGPITVQPGEEDTRCVVVRLGNATSINAHQIHNYLGPVSHHFIVYRTNETTERTEPFACSPFTDTLDPSRGAPLMITQKVEETLTLPDGVAFTLDPNQMIRLELHYINTGDTAAQVQATSTFVPMPDEEFQYSADFIFMGDVNIDIPAHSTATLGPTYVPIPAELNGVSYFAITGHVHQWGTDVVVDTASAPSTPVDTVYDVTSFDWDEPETVRYEPAFTAPDNGGFRITCRWDNKSDSTVQFGEGANDEMCFFWAYYYPSVGAKVCFAHSGFGVSGCCPDHPLCSQL